MKTGKHELTDECVTMWCSSRCLNNSWRLAFSFGVSSGVLGSMPKRHRRLLGVQYPRYAFPWVGPDDPYSEAIFSERENITIEECDFQQSCPVVCGLHVAHVV